MIPSLVTPVGGGRSGPLVLPSWRCRCLSPQRQDRGNTTHAGAQCGIAEWLAEEELGSPLDPFGEQAISILNWKLILYTSAKSELLALEQQLRDLIDLLAHELDKSSSF